MTPHLMVWQKFPFSNGSQKTKANEKKVPHLGSLSRELLRAPSRTLPSCSTTTFTSLSKHLFNIKQQYTCCRELRKNMATEETLIHVDFSNNYVCRYTWEIQADAFGAPHLQPSLHTGVLTVCRPTGADTLDNHLPL